VGDQRNRLPHRIRAGFDDVAVQLDHEFETDQRKRSTACAGPSE
jgi:hypothetical protein